MQIRVSKRGGKRRTWLIGGKQSKDKAVSASSGLERSKKVFGYLHVKK
jgi:hypothetical protein